MSSDDWAFREACWSLAFVVFGPLLAWWAGRNMIRRP